MGFRNRYLAAALIAAGMTGSVALAATMAEVIGSRQASFKQVAKANKAIADELKASSPSMAVIRANAAIIGEAGNRALRAFPAGSGTEAGVKTAALPAIWERPADFRKASSRFLSTSRALGSAAEQGNPDDIRAAAAGLGQSCKGCHTSFRAKD